MQFKDLPEKVIAENSASQNKLIKTATDCANAVFGKQRGELPLYRNLNLISIHTINQELTRCCFMKTTMKGYDGMAQKVSQIFLPKAYYITKDGQPGVYFVNAVLGLVLVKH